MEEVGGGVGGGVAHAVGASTPCHVPHDVFVFKSKRFSRTFVKTVYVCHAHFYKGKRFPKTFFMTT